MHDMSDSDKTRLEEKPSTVDVKLSGELQLLVGGRKYVNEEELTREVLLEWAKRQGAVKEVNLISVTVQTMGGTELEVTLDDSDNTVSRLKRCIQDAQGVACFTQQLFLASKGGDTTEVKDEAMQEPLGDNELISVDCCVALYIDAEEENSWDLACGLITVSIAVVVLLDY
jgi:hypothetical protein